MKHGKRFTLQLRRRPRFLGALITGAEEEEGSQVGASHSI